MSEKSDADGHRYEVFFWGSSSAAADHKLIKQIVILTMQMIGTTCLRLELIMSVMRRWRVFWHAQVLAETLLLKRIAGRCRMGLIKDDILLLTAAELIPRFQKWVPGYHHLIILESGEARVSSPSDTSTCT